MPKEYRSRLRILHDILQTIQREPRLGTTRLLFLSNLSHDRLTDYVAELKKRHWVVETEKTGKRTYELSPDGHKFLAELRKIHAFVADFGLEI